MYNEPTLTDYVVSTRRSWKTVLLCIAIGGILGALGGTSTLSSKAVVEFEVIDEILLASGSTQSPLLPGQAAARISAFFDSEDIDGSAELPLGSRTVRVQVFGDAATAERQALGAAQMFVREQRAVRQSEYEITRAFHAERIPTVEETLDEIRQQINDVAASGGDTVSLQTELVVSLGQLVGHRESVALYDTLLVSANAQVTDPVLTKVEGSGSAVLFTIMGLILGSLTGIGLAILRTHRAGRVRRLADLEPLVDSAILRHIIVEGQDVMTSLNTLSRALRDSTPMTLLEFGTDALAEPLAEMLRSGGSHPVNTLSTAGSDWSDSLESGDHVALMLRVGDVSSTDAIRTIDTISKIGAVPVAVVLSGVPASEESWAAARPVDGLLR